MDRYAALKFIDKGKTPMQNETALMLHDFDRETIEWALDRIGQATKAEREAKKYGFQVLIETNGVKSWAWVHPTGRGPYRYATEQEAARMMDMCYPMQINGVEKRVKKFED